MHKDIYEKFKGYDEKSWLKILFSTPDNNAIEGIRFPGFPDSELQIKIIGSSGVDSLREVSLFYLLIHQYLKAVGLPITAETKALDFGCGYGRILRFFMKDIAPGKLIGTDVDPNFIDMCRRHFCGGDFDLNGPLPPLRYQDASIDIIYSYSIFSHLSEGPHLKWLQEFKRILKPEGLIFLTCRQESFLKQCRSMTSIVDPPPYAAMLIKAFGDYEAMMKRYRRGEYIYAPHGGGGVRTNDYYGDTVIPPMYIENVWRRHFHIVDSFDDPSRLAQSLVVLSKEPKTYSVDKLRASKINGIAHLARKILRKLAGFGALNLGGYKL